MKMRTDRLMLVAAKLRTDMMYFGNNVGDNVRPRFDCHTAACAAGWATTIPVLRRAGLRMRWSPYDTSDGKQAYGGLVHFGNMTGEVALACFFRLTLMDVDRVFYAGLKMSPKEKAEQIETFCRQYEETQGQS